MDLSKHRQFADFKEQASNREALIGIVPHIVKCFISETRGFGSEESGHACFIARFPARDNEGLMLIELIPSKGPLVKNSEPGLRYCDKFGLSSSQPRKSAISQARHQSSRELSMFMFDGMLAQPEDY